MANSGATCKHPLCPCGRANRLILAEAAETPADCPNRLPPAAAYSDRFRALASREYYITSRAAAHIATEEDGGSNRAVADLVTAGRLLLLRGDVRAPSRWGGGGKKPGKKIPPGGKLPTKKSWIKIKVVDDQSGIPIARVAIFVRDPSGGEREYTTRPDGMIELDEINPGECELRCDLEGARLEDTLDFVMMGDAPSAGEVSGVGADAGEASSGGAAEGTGGHASASAQPPASGSRIAEIEEHQVQTGETLQSVGETAGMTRQELAEFNWGTTERDEINQHLREDVGCTRRGDDGFMSFDTEDDPGVVYVPSEWRQSGLATGQEHTVRVRALRFVVPPPISAHPARLHANFDRREGGQNVDTSAEHRKTRILRPGAVILPNLDIDEDSAKPRTRFAVDEVDALFDDRVNAGDDEHDVTQFKVVEPQAGLEKGVKLILQVHEKDARRVRVWRIPKGKTLKDAVEVIGPKKGNKFTIVDGRSTKTSPGAEHNFAIEALSLAADVPPVSPALEFFTPPADLAPPPAGDLNTPRPDTKGGSQVNPTVNNSDTSSSSYPKDRRFEDGDKSARPVGDVWIELIHEGSAATERVRDVGLFTIAPWLLTWNTLNCTRLYVPNMPRGPRPTELQTALLAENHSTVWDLSLASFLAGHSASAPDPDTRKPIPNTDHKTVRDFSAARLYIVDGDKTGTDPFIQDQFEVGYCFAPHGALHVALHNKRFQAFPNFNRDTGGWLVREFPHAGLGVYNVLALIHKRGQDFELVFPTNDSVDFGGNLEVSPPISKATKPLGAGKAGPAVKKHRPAPFGKVILGDSKDRPCEEGFRKLLLAQKVQPVLPIDTSWLSVGHVDEIMSFVRSNARPFKVPFADTRAMSKLVRNVLQVEPDATIHAGCYQVVREEAGVRFLYAEEPLELFLLSHLLESSVANLQRLQPIRERLVQGLNLAEDDLIPVPMLFKTVPADPFDPASTKRALAASVGMVNMQVVNNSVFIPRPFGPLLPPSQARKALRRALKDIFGSKAPPVAEDWLDDDHFFWARPGESLRAIAMYFVRPSLPQKQAGKVRRKLIQRLLELSRKDFDPQDDNWNLTDLGPGVKNDVDELLRAILGDPVNIGQGVTPAVGGILENLDAVANPHGPDGRFIEWQRLRIPDGTVDVMEGYMHSVFEANGNGVLFISAFEWLHERSGEVHCGTNTIRANPESDSKFKHRWWDKGVYDPDQDTSYSVS